MNPLELENEALLRRPLPPGPYRPGAAVLRVPRQAVALTAAVFEPYATRGLEACCFWYGTLAGDTATVAGVVVPGQRNARGYYNVSADAIVPVANATRARGWKNLSQIHTHPGVRVEHSRYDDSHANSRRALSLVFPFYGRWTGTWPLGIGVHEFQDEYWHLLSDVHAARRVFVVDGSAELVDKRP